LQVKVTRSHTRRSKNVATVIGATSIDGFIVELIEFNLHDSPRFVMELPRLCEDPRGPTSENIWGLL